MQGLIVVITLVALVASFVVINTRKPKPRPVKVAAQPKHRQLRRPSKDRQKRYYQRRIRTLQQQHMAILVALLYHQYRAKQATPIYN